MTNRSSVPLLAEGVDDLHPQLQRLLKIRPVRRVIPTPPSPDNGTPKRARKCRHPVPHCLRLSPGNPAGFALPFLHIDQNAKLVERLFDNCERRL